MYISMMGDFIFPFVPQFNNKLVGVSAWDFVYS